MRDLKYCRDEDIDAKLPHLPDEITHTIEYRKLT